MAVSRISTQSIQQGFPKGDTFWDGTTATSAYDSLGSVYVSTATSTITFSNIPQTYTHLELRGFCRNSGSSNEYVKLTFNSDSNANYSEHHLSGNGSTVTAGANANFSNGGFFWGMGIPFAANTFGLSITSILDYSNTSKYKTLRSIDGFDANGSGGVEIVSNSWRSNTAVTSISMTPNSSANFAPYTTISLYGIK